MFGGWWFASSRERYRDFEKNAGQIALETNASSPDQAEGRPVVQPSGAVDDRAALETAVDSGWSQRAPVAVRSALSSYLRGASGEQIADAAITWTPLRPEFFGIWVGWANQRWGEIAAASLVSTSDETGFFEFAVPPEGFDTTPSVLWVTHKRHLPKLVQVAASDGQPEFPPAIELASGMPITVRVVDGNGAPVAGAWVEQTTAVPTSALADTWDPQARRILSRTTATGADGRAAVAAWDGPLFLRASLGKLSSTPWIAEPRGEVELVLLPTFEVYGAVTLERGSQIEGEQRVVCQVIKSGQLQPLTIAPVESGRWGPVVLPLVPGDGYRFRVEGWNAEIREQAIMPPEPGSTVRVDFTLRAGHEVWILVHDGTEVPLPGASATVVWDQDGISVEVKYHQLDNGYINARGIPAGTVDILCEAPGYATLNRGSTMVPNPVTYLVQLFSGRAVEGRVLYRDQPVPDFEVSAWTGGNAPLVSRFRDRADGSFTLQAVSTDETHVAAAAHGSGVSEIVAIPAGTKSPTPLTIELRDLVRGSGKVVAAATGNPLPDARVQAYTTLEGRAVAPWGPSWNVESDGSFDREGFATGRSRTRFSAPGYSFHWAETFAQPGEAIDFGLIALTARKDLTVQLMAEEGFDYTKLSLSSNGAEPIGERLFDITGRLVIEQVSAGEYTLVISDRKGTWFEVPARLHPDDAWNLSIPVSGSHRLRVSLSPSTETAGGAYVLITLPGPGREQIFFVREPLDERSTEVSSLYTGEFRAALYDSDDQLLGSANGVIREDDTLVEAIIELARTRQSFRVVDQAGAPLSNVRLGVWGEEETHRGGGDDTDKHGECSIAPFWPGRYRASMIHPELGYHLGVPIDVPRLTGEPIEIVFAADLAVEVHLLDGLESLPALHCWLSEERTGFHISAATSNAGGHVRWSPLGAGRFLLKVSQLGFWPTEAVVEARPPGEENEVQVRRLGDLEVNLFQVSGGPASGTAFELESLEFEASVATWINEGRVESSTGALTTDTIGRFVLTGLPHGTYRWSAPGTSGTVEVTSMPRRRLNVTLP